MTKQKTDSSTGSSSSERNKGSSPFWEMAGQLVIGAFKNFETSIVQMIKSQVALVLEQVQRGLSGGLLLLIGIVFILVGCATFINDLIGMSRGIGFSVIGCMVFLVGYLILKR